MQELMHPTMRRLYQAARERLNLTKQAQVAKALGESSQTIKNWENRGVSKGGMIKAQTVIGCSVTWLETGKSVPMMKNPRLDAGQQINFASGPQITGRVPLVSWETIRQRGQLSDPLTQKRSVQMIPTTAEITDSTYAVKVEGESMEPEFPAGTLLIVEPGLEPRDGDYVIAGVGQEATFRQYVVDGGESYLKPSNARYPMRSLGDMPVQGVVVATERRLR